MMKRVPGLQVSSMDGEASAATPQQLATATAFPPLLTSQTSKGNSKSNSKCTGRLSAYKLLANGDPSVERELRSLQVGHNLNSVLNGPDASPTNMFQTSLAERFFGFSSLFERDDFDASPPIASVIAPVEISAFNDYRSSNSQLIDVYLANHDTARSFQNQESYEHMKSPSRRRTEEFERTRGGLSAADVLERCMTQVPAKYFNKEFSLNDTEMFENDSSTTASLMHEHLSNWLDLVEVCLWSQTTTQAPSLFSSLTDLQSLRVQVSDACGQIRDLREMIGKVRSNVCEGNLLLLKKRRGKDRRLPVVSLLSQIDQVRKVVPAVKDLLATSQEYASALDSIRETRQTLNTNLKGVKCLRTVSRQLTELEVLVGDELDAKFVNLAVHWELAADEELEKQLGITGDIGRIQGLGVLVHGLLKLKNDRIRSTLRHYRARVVEEVDLSWEKTIEATVATLAEGNANGEVTGLRQLRSKISSFPPKAFEDFLGVAFGTLRVIVLQCRSVHSELVFAVKKFKEDGPQTALGDVKCLTPAQQDKIVSTSASILESVIGHVEEIMKAELDARRRSKVAIQMQELCRVWNMVLGFSRDIETLVDPVLPNHQLLNLGGALHNMPKSYLNKMHEAHKTRLVEVTDAEDWKPFQEIPYTIQKIVRYIETGEQPRGSSGNQVAKSLWIQKRQYKMIRTVPVLLGLVQQYLVFSQSFQSSELVAMAVDRLAKLLIKFSNLIEYLIVQAGATEASRKLESVTTKHFARASQALSSILALLGPMETLLLGSLGNKGDTPEANEIKAKMEEVRDNMILRREQVFKGTVSLVEKLLDRYCANLSTMVNWDASDRSGTASSRSAHQYIEDIVDKLGRFHAQLVSSLPPEQLQQVFDMVFEVINTKIPILFADVRPVTPMGRARMKIDIKRLVSFLRQLRGTNGPGDALENFLLQRDKQANS